MKKNAVNDVIILIIKGGITQPTPNYNNSILEDMFLEENSEFVRKTFLGSRSLVEALILMKVQLFWKGIVLFKRKKNLFKLYF